MTITLIAVVILFLVCQTPNALQMLRIMDLDSHRNRDLGKEIKKIKLKICFFLLNGSDSDFFHIFLDQY